MKKKIICTIVWIVIFWILSYFWYNYYKYYKNNWIKYEYYDDGTIRSEYILENWELNWKATAYYPNWQISSITNRENGHKEWEYITYFKNWMLRAHYFIKNWHEDLSKESIGYYSNKQMKRYRDWDYGYTDYFTNGQINTIWNYNISWQKIWEWKQYNEAWKHIATLIYNNWEPYSWNIYHYRYRYFDEDEYEDVYLKSINNYKDWTLNWTQYEYDEDWNITKKSTYVNWQKDWKEYEYKNWKIINVYERRNWEFVYN